jgi:hypothetical protein
VPESSQSSTKVRICTRQRQDFDGRSRWCDLCIGYTGWQRPECPEVQAIPQKSSENDL